MYVMKVAKRWVPALCLCGIPGVLAGCDLENQKVVTMPVVTEESLSPEQKAILDARRKQEAAVMGRVGATGSTDPQEFARQRMEEVKAQQAAEQEAASAANNQK